MTLNTINMDKIKHTKDNSGYTGLNVNVMWLYVAMVLLTGFTVMLYLVSESPIIDNVSRYISTHDDSIHIAHGLLDINPYRTHNGTHGTNNATSESLRTELYRVPNVMHYVWYSLEGNGREFVFVNYLSVLSAYHVQRPDHIMFHCNRPPVTSAWWRQLLRDVPVIIVHEQIEVSHHSVISEQIIFIIVI